MELSFCTTSCVRPELLEKTYSSFKRHLKGIEMAETDLFINIDPLPALDCAKVEEMISICRRYFAKVTANISHKPSFPQAVSWCWSSAKTDLILHLEDDWELLEDVDVTAAILAMNADKKTLQYVFRAYEYRYKRLVLSPSLIKKDLYKYLSSRIKPHMNPELQLHAPGKVRGQEAENIQAYPGDRAVVRDLGREWLRDKGLTRGDSKRDFITWK